MQKTAEARRYGPLSIEDEGDIDGEGVHKPHSPYYERGIGQTIRGCCRRRRVCTIVLFLLCMIGSALLVAKQMFHLSLPNLFRTILGGTHSHGGTTNATGLEPVCLPPNKYHDNQTTTIESMIHNKRAIESIQFDKSALTFNKSLSDDKTIISQGFFWDDQDAVTTKWRPQGVATYHSPGASGQRWALVSWYGRKDEGYAERGGRISFVDITGMQLQSTNYPSCPYRHVLLVDENFCTLPTIHVGGIEQQNGTLYVADSRKGMQAILEFDIANGLYEVPPDEISTMFGYRYVLRQSGSFHSPTKPSFISYDIDNHKFIVGSYARCGKKMGVHLDSEKCFTQPKNRLVWFDKVDLDLNSTPHSNTTTDTDSSSCWHYFSEMQGAVSARVHNNSIVWVSSSYGPIADSHLHMVNVSSSFTGECSQIGSVDMNEVPILRYPPGLEDLSVEQIKDERYMWMVTEFGTRMVFVTSLQDILPAR